MTLASSTGLTTLDSSMTAMLRLSDDIGSMADRIVATQAIQSDNLKVVVVDAVLQSQQNTILLIAAFNL